MASSYISYVKTCPQLAARTHKVSSRFAHIRWTVDVTRSRNGQMRVGHRGFQLHLLVPLRLLTTRQQKPQECYSGGEKVLPNTCCFQEMHADNPAIMLEVS